MITTIAHTQLKRVLQLSLVLILIIGACSPAPAAQDPSSWIQGPILGFVQDGAGAVIWPILGVPGAAALGPRLHLETEIHGAIISPKQDYAIAVRNEDGRAILIGFTSDAIGIRPIDTLPAGVDILTTSPTGSIAVLYSHASRSLRVIQHLPELAETVFDFDASALAGRVWSVAVSDDATLAVIALQEGPDAGIWLVDLSGSTRLLASTHSGAIAFVANSHDLIVADNEAQQIFLLANVNETTNRIPLISSPGIDGFSGVAASTDGRRIFVAGQNSHTVAIVDLDTGSSTLIPCECRPTGIHPLKGLAVLRLNDASLNPVAVLDASSAEPRIVVIPPEVDANTPIDRRPEP